MITAQGRVNEKKSNVLPAVIFDTIKHAVKIPVKIAYNSVFVKSSNIKTIIFPILNKFYKLKSYQVFNFKNIIKKAWKLLMKNY